MKTKGGLSYVVGINTTEMPGKIVATRVMLDTAIFGMNDRMRVDLCDHPLYPKLVEYVRLNPPKAKSA